MLMRPVWVEEMDTRCRSGCSSFAASSFPPAHHRPLSRARACLPLPCRAPAAHGVLSCGRKPPRASYQELDMIRLLARMHAPADLDAAAHEAERVGTAHRVHALPCNMAVQLLSDREYIRDRYQGRSSLLACEFARRDACTRVVRSMGTAASVVGACCAEPQADASQPAVALHLLVGRAPGGPVRRSFARSTARGMGVLFGMLALDLASLAGAAI